MILDELKDVMLHNSYDASTFTGIFNVDAFLFGDYIPSDVRILKSNIKKAYGGIVEFTLDPTVEFEIKQVLQNNQIKTTNDILNDLENVPGISALFSTSYNDKVQFAFIEKGISHDLTESKIRKIIDSYSTNLVSLSKQVGIKLSVNKRKVLKDAKTKYIKMEVSKDLGKNDKILSMYGSFTHQLSEVTGLEIDSFNGLLGMLNYYGLSYMLHIVDYVDLNDIPSVMYEDKIDTVATIVTRLVLD